MPTLRTVTETLKHHPCHSYVHVNKMPMPDRALKIINFMLSLDWCIPKLLCPISAELTN